MDGIQGPRGEAGMAGTVQGVYATEQDMRDDNPGGGSTGEFHLVGNIDDGFVLYVWNDTSVPPDWVNTGTFTGAEGPQGPQGQPVIEL